MFSFVKYIKYYLNGIQRPSGNYAIANPKVCALCGDTNVDYAPDWKLDDIKYYNRKVRKFSNGTINLWPERVPDPKGSDIVIEPKCICKECNKEFFDTVFRLGEENNWDFE